MSLCEQPFATSLLISAIDFSFLNLEGILPPPTPSLPITFAKAAVVSTTYFQMDYHDFPKLLPKLPQRDYALHSFMFSVWQGERLTVHTSQSSIPAYARFDLAICGDVLLASPILSSVHLVSLVEISSV